MPLVQISYDPKKLTKAQLLMVVYALPNLVSGALDAPPEGKLSPQEINVWTRKFQPEDIRYGDLEIVVFANQYPERQENINQRQQLITQGVRELVPTVRGSVWVLLCPGSFGTFAGYSAPE